MARPTEYDPKYCEEIDKYLAQAVPENMDIPTVEGFALRMGITKKTLYNWSKQNKKFLHALGRLKMQQKVHLIRTGIFGGKEINQTIVSLLLKVNHKMIETSKTDITSGGKPLQKPILDGLHNNHSDSEADKTT
jgi:hypothetical protein